MKNDTFKALVEVFIGMILFSVPALILISIFSPNKLYGWIGFAAGILVAVVMLVSMYFTIDRAVHTPGHSQAYMGIISAGRLIMVAVFMLLMAKWDIPAFVTSFVGLMSLKVGTYLQPAVHKFIRRKDEEN